MRSLRGRLTLGVVLVLAAVLAVAGVLVARYVDSSERDALDDRLERTAELSQATALDAVEDGLPDSDSRLDASLEATQTSLRLLVGTTTLLDTGAPPPHRPRLPLGLRTFARDGRRYRAFTTTLRDPDLEGVARLEIVTALAGLEDRQADLERRLLGLGLLALLVRHAGEVLDRPRLHREVWGYTFDPGTNVADVFVGYLRRKLEAGGEPRILHTVRGVGWVLRP